MHNIHLICFTVCINFPGEPTRDIKLRYDEEGLYKHETANLPPE
jgi:hypothetical protein